MAKRKILRFKCPNCKFRSEFARGLGRHRAAMSGRDGHVRYAGKAQGGNEVVGEHDEATAHALSNIEALLETVTSFLRMTVKERDDAVARAVQAEAKLEQVRAATAQLI